MRRGPRDAGADSAGARGDGQVLLLELLDEVLPAILGEKEAGRLLLEADVDGEGVSSGANHHYVLRFVHDGAGEGDGVARVLDVGDGSGFEGCSVHYSGVHLIGAVGGEDGSAPALKRGLSSRISIAVCTASVAEPPLSRTAPAAVMAWLSPARY